MEIKIRWIAVNSASGGQKVSIYYDKTIENVKYEWHVYEKTFKRNPFLGVDDIEKKAIELIMAEIK